VRGIERRRRVVDDVVFVGDVAFVGRRVELDGRERRAAV
jgi:hypothetical protein